MVICFDYQIFWLQAQGGISRYFCELAAHLSQFHDCDPHIVAPYHANNNLREIESRPYVHVFNPALRKVFYNRFWDKRTETNEKLGAWYLKNKKAVLHETYYTHRFPSKKPRVTTIHDMIYEKFNRGLRDELEIIEAKKKAIMEADAVIAVSESTKRDIVEIYPETRSKIKVVHHGVRLPSVTVKQNSGKPYLLFVGNRGWYKNFDVLLDVYAGDRTLNEIADLCCFGGEQPTEQEKKVIAGAGLEKKVRFVRGDDKLLAALYAGAAMLVYNSAYEGFGLPVLEAMACGCPVICSNTSSLPEVAGEAAMLIDPKNKGELLSAILKVMHQEERQKLVEAGFVRAAGFSWRRCANETFKVYETLV